MTTATRITLADFDRMIADGFFDARTRRSRIELIDGELRQMSPIGSSHERIVSRLLRWSCANTSEDVICVRVQCSIGIPEFDCVPEPDVVWSREKDYGSGRPLPIDILLIIEVSDSSLRYDRGEKADMYAAAAIAEYWVVNIPDGCVEVFREPDQGRYHSREVYTAPSEVHPLAFPQLGLPVELLFRSKSAG